MSICIDSLLSPAMRAPEVVWASLTYDQARTAMDETRHATGTSATFNESRMSCTLPNGGRILYRSLDKPDNIRSKTAGGIVIDEAPFTDGRAWHEVIRPMLIDTNGWAWLIGTPRGRNWYYKEWQQAQGREGWATFHAPTLGVEITAEGLKRKPHPFENPDIPFAEIVDLYRSVPERVFRQEILAEFVEDGGGVIRNVRARATARPQAEPAEGHTYVAGVDWALSNDSTVLTIVDATARAVAMQDAFTSIDYRLQRERIHAACRRFRVSVVMAEENAMGKPNNDELRRMGLPVRDFTTTNTTKAEIIETLAGAFERGDIAILNDDTLIAELEALESKRTPSGLTTYSAPSGIHDDRVMSLAFAWEAARTGSPFKGI